MPDSTLSRLENLSEKDRIQLQRAEEILGPDSETIGFLKNLFWGRFRSDLVFPYPEVGAEEQARCDRLLADLDGYLRLEHPHFEIDRNQEIPDWVVARLFELGVMGMIIPREYGGGGFGITSYNRVLERIGRTCGSTAVLVSAHQSIGCGAIVLFGSEEQKRRFLPRMSRDTLSAFCLSEPNVGCDAAGQETRCELSADGSHYVLDGEKKWATSGALAGLFTVTARQRLTDPATGAAVERVTALVCTPDMEGIDVYSRNRSKCGIRGTWQARIRFTGVRVPRANLLHREGKGLQVALTCLDYGRTTLSAGMLGAAKAAFEQAVKWSEYRYQFERPIGEFELVRAKIAEMAARTYAMEAMLYMTTGFIDRGDPDLMVETAACKVFCSDSGFRTVEQAMQVMGGESYMSENVVERLWRDSRINTIVEGANEVMHSFIFGYGAKQLGEHLLRLRARPLRHPAAALGAAAEMFLGLRRPPPPIEGLHPRLETHRRALARMVRDLSHETKRAFARHREKLVSRQLVQYRLSQAAIWTHALACALARADRSLRGAPAGDKVEDELRVVAHVAALAREQVDGAFRALGENSDATLDGAAEAARRATAELPNSDYTIPERTPVASARGTGRTPDPARTQQFGAGSLAVEETSRRTPR
jgi:alkylation response protein AidB-like acyl-CoA dehydrogenase